jgi:hypothetical protein
MVELDLDTARAELQEKSKAEIDADAAAKWAARAIAALELALAATDLREQVKWMLDAREYEHEAGEHAGGAGCEFFQEIESAIKEHKKALKKKTPIPDISEAQG